MTADQRATREPRSRGEARPSLPLLVWDGPLYCHAPVDDPFDPAALAEAGDGGDRWSREGQPTAYLASDAGVAMAELARHHPPEGERVERRVIRLEPRGGAVRGLVDLRDAAVLRAIGAPAEASRYLSREVALAAAQRVRADRRHLGLIVPSMAFLDHPARPNVVLFADRLGDEGIGGLLASWREVARIWVGGR